MFKHLGSLVARRWALVVLGWLTLLAAIQIVAPRWDDITEDGDFAFLPSEMTSVQGEKLLEAAFPHAPSKSQLAIVVARPDDELTASDFQVADRLLALFTPDEGDPGPVTNVWSYESQIVGRRLIRDSNAGGQAVLIVLHLGNEFMAVGNMALLRTVNRALDVVQLEEAVVRALEAQQAARQDLDALARLPVDADREAAVRQIAERQRAVREGLLPYVQWFTGTTHRELGPIETALGRCRAALAATAGQPLSEASRLCSALSESQGAAEDFQKAVEAAGEAQQQAFDRLQAARGAIAEVLQIMRRVALAEEPSLDFLSKETVEELAAVGSRLDAAVPPGDRASAAPPRGAAGDRVSPGGLQIGVTGSAAVGSDMLFAARESIRNTELTTVILVVIILLAVYRAPGLVLVPLVTIAASTAVAMGLVALVSQAGRELGWFDFHVFKTTKIFIVVLLFGAGTDFCLFLIARYREELERGLEVPRATAHALAHVGDALAASALTTILGLTMMVFADFGKFRNSGPVIAFCLLVALAASVTLAPALLRGMGRYVFWPFRFNGGPEATRHPHAAANPPEPRSWFGWLWTRVAGQVVTRPGLVLIACVLLLAPMAVEGVHVPVTYDLLSELPPHRPSVRGTRLLERFFLPGEIGPVALLAHAPDPRFATERGREQIAVLTRRLFDFEYTDSAGNEVHPIYRVRSRSEPLGGPPGSFLSPHGFEKMVVLNHPKTKARFLAQSPGYTGRVTRLDLVFLYDPFSRESVRLLDRVETYLDRMATDPDSPWFGTVFYFAGTTAAVRDLAAVTTSDRRVIQQLVVIAVLGVLIVLLRHAVLSMYMIVSVLFGYFVSIGATEWVFRAIYGPTFDGLDWKVPVFLFVILIAVGQDYNIYLATRVFEEQKRRGRKEGLRAAVIRTGGIITSCGIIMAGTFASMTTGTLRAMQELGFALAFGVLLDTLVIRTVLLPAFLALSQRWGEGHRWPEDQAEEGEVVPAAPHRIPIAAEPLSEVSRAPR